MVVANHSSTAQDANGFPSEDGARTRSVRTARACDRCRSKKSKCNGEYPCSTCTSNDLLCRYETIRTRDARLWQRERYEVMEEGLHRLYAMCRDARIFPVELVHDSNGKVSTEGILRSLGLIARSDQAIRLSTSDALSPSLIGPPQHTESHQMQSSRYPSSGGSELQSTLCDIDGSSPTRLSMTALDMPDQFQLAIHEPSLPHGNTIQAGMLIASDLQYHHDGFLDHHHNQYSSPNGTSFSIRRRSDDVASSMNNWTTETIDRLILPDPLHSMPEELPREFQPQESSVFTSQTWHQDPQA